MRKTVMIGVGVLVVLLAAGLWVADRQGLLPGYAQLRTFMDDASGLTDGTKVRLNGISIGYLDHQSLTGSPDRNRRVEFDMKVKSSYLAQIPVDSTVRVVADNLLSDKAINILPGSAAEVVTNGAELRSSLAVDPNKIMAQMNNTLQQFEVVMNRASTMLSSVDAGEGNIGKLKTEYKARWSNIPVEMRKLMKDYRNAHGSMDKILVNNGELTAQIQTTQKRFDDILGAFQAGQGTAGKLANVSKDFEPVQREIDSLKAAIQSRTVTVDDVGKRMDALMLRFAGMVDRVNSGEGTAGQFLTNPQFSEAMAGSGREFQALVKDMQANPKRFFTLRLALF